MVKIVEMGNVNVETGYPKWKLVTKYRHPFPQKTKTLGSLLFRTLATYYLK